MKHVAILGCGVVGSGVAEVLKSHREEIRRRCGEELSLRYILVRRRKDGSPWQEYFTEDFSVIENDPEVSLVAECIGGVGAALDYDRRALLAGKSVVTSNKELVAKHGRELSALAREKGVSFLFEASVGGGIPVLRPIGLCLAGNRISEAVGVINGTTNYILTTMQRSGAAFEEVLAEAQRLGYAERDPSADILGWDTGRKACILADLCFGKNADPGLVSMEGITGVTAEDMAAAAALGCAVKLLGRAVRTQEGAAVYAAPHLLPLENPLARLEGVTNGVLLRGDAVGEVFLSGPGAGSLPTASAVVGDLAEAALCAGRPRDMTWEAAEEGWLIGADKLKSRWYLRCSASEAAVRERAGAAACVPAGGGCAFITEEELDGAQAASLGVSLGAGSLFRVLS